MLIIKLLLKHIFFTVIPMPTYNNTRFSLLLMQPILQSIICTHVYSTTLRHQHDIIFLITHEYEMLEHHTNSLLHMISQPNQDNRDRDYIRIFHRFPLFNLKIDNKGFPEARSFLSWFESLRTMRWDMVDLVLLHEMSAFCTEMVRSFGPHLAGKQFKISILFVDT